MYLYLFYSLDEAFSKCLTVNVNVLCITQEHVLHSTVLFGVSRSYEVYSTYRVRLKSSLLLFPLLPTVPNVFNACMSSFWFLDPTSA